MLTYQETERILAKRTTKKIARKTYLRRQNGDAVIRFWDTDIITISPDNVYTLNSGGYRTLTTRGRLNSFSPAIVIPDKGLWYVCDGQTATLRIIFADGIQVNCNGVVLGGEGSQELPKVLRKVNRLVSRYIAGYAVDVMKNGLQEDTIRDCRYCLMKDINNPKDKEPMGYDHYLCHFEEKYYVPSILLKAVFEEVGYRSPALVWKMMKADIERGREPPFVRRALRKYFRTRKLGIAEELLKKGGENNVRQS